MNKILKRIGYAVIAVVVGKVVGGYIGQGMATPSVTSVSATKSIEEAFLEGQKVMYAAFEKPASAFCVEQAKRQMFILEQTVQLDDRDWFIERMSKMCTGGQDMVRKMRYDWNMSDESIRSASNSVSKDILPMFKSRLEADGVEPSIAADVAHSFNNAMHAGYLVELAKPR